MYQHTRLTNNSFNFFQKFKNFDYNPFSLYFVAWVLSALQQCIPQMAVKFYFILKVIL